MILSIKFKQLRGANLKTTFKLIVLLCFGNLLLAHQSADELTLFSIQFCICLFLCGSDTYANKTPVL